MRCSVVDSDQENREEFCSAVVIYFKSNLHSSSLYFLPFVKVCHVRAMKDVCLGVTKENAPAVFTKYTALFVSVRQGARAEMVL